ncbi:N-acetylmuramic acid 6-phosphate etherase [Ruegeria halocynthiae]|uniref:N-acetylmuramic acid 6-phosphate etherase n=1 Tax=Ruegeria halocynthiae TaxID=985054 RepID=A0A1H2UCB3_9RHOB|nr:N-acetylmuramic acid 6-phosphate etherase [Ruegeria halocynthiae]SDW53841.1 N-acetylmuramic acid 6-phosphate etherase [Ruegeria halocynthiae]
MAAPVTEQLHQDAIGLDARPLNEVAELLARSQSEAATTPLSSLSPICTGAKAMAQTIRSGGVLRYLAAGSSGLMAASDALELGGTYSISANQIRIHMAGGLPSSVEMPGDVEDATDNLDRELAGLSTKDTLITVSASGTTPYTVAAARIARAKGATVIGIANNGETELLQLSDHSILLSTPPELISGSTRMGAGTAQKIALNMLSTLMAMELGHIQDGMMINLRADNEKLRARAKGIVCQLTGVAPEQAASALNAADGNLKCAALMAAGALVLEEAQAMLRSTDDHLRPALERLKQNQETINLGDTK